MDVLDLFSGIGGFSLGLERAGMTTVAFCEVEDYARRVLAKHWPDVPIHHDVRKLKGADVGAVDVICGGYPCQPFSLAGKRGGAEDDRHLWPEMRRLVDELRPSWVIGENVAGHISMGLDAVLSDLEALGYACRAFAIPALAVGAPHRRERLWIVAHGPGLGRRARRTRRSHPGGARQFKQALQDVADAARLQPGRQDERTIGQRVGAGGESLAVANADGQQARRFAVARGERNQWLAEPDVGRVAHGVTFRVDRLGRLGNAVVPAIPEIIGRAILAAEERS